MFLSENLLIERLCAHPNHLSTYYPNYFDKPTLLTAGAKGYRLTVMPACQLTAETEVKILNHVAAGSKLVDAARDGGQWWDRPKLDEVG